MTDPHARYLIVNGDDFGISGGVSRGILEAHQRGILTSTSLMVDRAAAEEATSLARRAPDLSVGLHLELSAGSDPRAAAARQIQRFERLLGRPPTHLDSHRDVHRDARVTGEILRVANELGVPLRGYSSARSLTRFYAQWGGETHLAQVSVDSLIGMLETDVEAGVTELMCHPGYADAALTSSYAHARETELQTLCDPRLRSALRHEGIQLAGFRDLPALLTPQPGESMRPAWQA
jgi:predicted glycoside hydrolase/deacetylase ChbG (UPF0249 family)